MAESIDAAESETVEAPDEAVRWPDIPDDASLWQRVNAVMRVVGFLEKDKVHEIRKEGKKVGEFDYISHDAVTAAIRPACVRYGISVLPNVVDHNKDGNRTELTVDTAFINIDKPEEQAVIRTVAYGVDNSDKGPGKAFSYAVKYAYLKFFMLNSADDIEKTDIEHDPADARASNIANAETAKIAAQEAWAKTFKTSIEAAKTEAELKALQREHKDMIMAVPEITREYFVGLIQDRTDKLKEKDSA